MAVNAFLTFFDKADGESVVIGKERWVELTDWSWQVTADTNWTTTTGATVGKPNPHTITWAHQFDTSSAAILGAICTGRPFPKVEIQMMKTVAGGGTQTYFTITMENAFITGVSHSADADGNVHQQVDMAFKTIKIGYKAQDSTGKLSPIIKEFTWDIPLGKATPLMV